MQHSEPDVLIKRLDPGVPMPSYAHPGDAGADLAAAEDVELAPGERALVRTGLAIALPAGYAAFVHPRSGLAAKYGVTLVNAPGTVDAGYRGEIKVTLLNTDSEHSVSFRRGDRIGTATTAPAMPARTPPTASDRITASGCSRIIFPTTWGWSLSLIHI